MNIKGLGCWPFNGTSRQKLHWLIGLIVVVLGSLGTLGATRLWQHDTRLAVHDTQLTSMVATVERIEGKVDRLLERRP